MLLVLLPFLTICLVCLYYANSTVEDTTVRYDIIFNTVKLEFGDVHTGITYQAHRCIHYHKFKRTEMYHYRDESYVHRYIDINDVSTKVLYSVKEVK